MCKKRPELGRHEASCLAQTFDDDERIGGFAELVDQRLHFGAEKLRRRFSADRAWIDTKKRFADFGVDGILASVKAAASENRSPGER